MKPSVGSVPLDGTMPVCDSFDVLYLDSQIVKGPYQGDLGRTSWDGDGGCKNGEQLINKLKKRVYLINKSIMENVLYVVAYVDL
jgi:hypothetical protein